jgi:hypothetical protein
MSKTDFKCRRCGKDISNQSHQVFRLGKKHGWFCLTCAAPVKTDKRGKAAKEELKQKIKELFESCPGA